MADRKISDLTALTTPASGDYLPIVDISEALAANKNKRITIEELLRGAPDGTAAAPGIAFESDPDSGLYSAGANAVAISTGGTERARIDSSGRLLVGASSSAASRQLIFQNSSEDALTVRVQSNSYPYNWINLDRQLAGGTAVISGANIGTISFRGWDGSNAIPGASISANVDGTPGANDMPGRLVFSVTADGASSPTEAMRIKTSRIINFANTPTYADNTAALAGGLLAGDVYRKSDGTLMITY